VELRRALCSSVNAGHQVSKAEKVQAELRVVSLVEGSRTALNALFDFKLKDRLQDVQWSSCRLRETAAVGDVSANVCE
jgi:hypothetical protein